ncbi:hypothetical protein HZM05_002812 [Salmonella enterica]|nr:hypothetical protein [Salmonella enterica]
MLIPTMQSGHDWPRRFKPDGVKSGEAAHITATAAGGPRYDPNMTSEERKGISNGIRMCAYHTGLIDNDYHSYSVEQLKNWKEIAESKQAELQRRLVK